MAQRGEQPQHLQQHHHEQEGAEVSLAPSRLGYRHLFAVLSFFGFVVVYALRICVSVTIVVMALDFDWDENSQGLVLSSFFFGYVVLQIPGGIVAEVVGGKRVFGLGILFTCLFTLLTPWAAKNSFGMLVAVRALTGLSESVSFPSMHAMISRWSLPEERSRMSGVIYAGMSVGTVVSMPLSAVICVNHGWEAVFYYMGGAGLGWCLAWAILASDTPAQSRFMPRAEMVLIAEQQGQQVREMRPPVPYKSIFQCKPFYAILVAHVAQAFGNYVMLTEMPTYMKQILHFPLEEDGYLSALPYVLCFLLSILSCFLGDFLIDSRIMSITLVRKLMTSFAFGTAIFALLALSFVDGNKPLSIALLCISVGAFGTLNAGQCVNHIDIAPNFAGTLMGLTNFAAQFAGIIAPYSVGTIIRGHDDVVHWRIVFLMVIAIYFVGSVVYCIFASAEVQPFNDLQHDNMALIQEEDEDEDDPTEIA